MPSQFTLISESVNEREGGCGYPRPLFFASGLTDQSTIPIDTTVAQLVRICRTFKQGFPGKNTVVSAEHLNTITHHLDEPRRFAGFFRRIRAVSLGRMMISRCFGES